MTDFQHFLYRRKNLDEQIHCLVSLIIEAGYNPERFLREQIMLTEQGFLNRTLGRFGNWWDRVWGRKQASTYEKAVQALQTLAGEMKDKPEMSKFLNDMTTGLKSRMEKIKGSDIPGEKEEKPAIKEPDAKSGSEENPDEKEPDNEIPTINDTPSEKAPDVESPPVNDKPNTPAPIDHGMNFPGHDEKVTLPPSDYERFKKSNDDLSNLAKYPLNRKLLTGKSKGSLVNRANTMPTRTSDPDVIDADFTVKEPAKQITHQTQPKPKQLPNPAKFPMLSRESRQWMNYGPPK